MPCHFSPNPAHYYKLGEARIWCAYHPDGQYRGAIEVADTYINFEIAARTAARLWAKMTRGYSEVVPPAADSGEMCSLAAWLAVDEVIKTPGGSRKVKKILKTLDETKGMIPILRRSRGDRQ